MHTPRPTRPTRKTNEAFTRAAVRSPGHGTVRAIVLIDEQPIRKSVVTELRKLQKTYLKLRHEIEHHEGKVRPSFHRWYHGRFFKKVVLVEKLREEFEEKMALLNRMRDLYAWRGLTRQKAFSQATEDLEALKKAQAEQEEAAHEEPKPDEEDFDEPEFTIDDEATGLGQRSRARAAKFADPTEDLVFANRAKEIKYFYRKLAQVLHPDRNAQQSESLRELWLDTQNAYAQADLERLKLIWTECIVEVDPASGEVRLSDLHAALSKLRAKIKTAQNEKRDLSKTDPTWNFEKKNKEDLAQEILSEFFTAEMDLTGSIRTLDREIKAFSGHPNRPGNRRKPARDFEDAEF